MADKKVIETKPENKPLAKKKMPGRAYTPLFGRENYLWMAIGLAVMALGLILMAGGKSKDPNTFDPKEVYSFTRITVAPILILAGLTIEIIAIFKKKKDNTNTAA